MTLSRLKAPPNLRDLVKQAFTNAVSSGHVNYYPTQVCILTINSVAFQLRFSPALANKPKGPPPSTSTSTTTTTSSSSSSTTTSTRPFFDPFDSPDPAMLISPVGPSHFLLLNKFAIVPEHFILATNAYKPQSHVLEQDDLEATLACIRAYQDQRRSEDDNGNGNSNSNSNDDGLFAFFNCGPHSGASQPHRHIQLLPVSRMTHDLPPPSSPSSSPSSPSWSLLSASPSLPSLQSLPFLTFAEPITETTSPQDLHATYLRLYRLACHAVALHTGGSQTHQIHHPPPPAPAPQDPPANNSNANTNQHQDLDHAGNRHLNNDDDDDDAADDMEEARISYNLALTKDAMVLCPRMAEGAHILDPGNGDVIGSLSLNGTLLAGTALVKNEVEWDALRRSHPEPLLGVLKRIGIPRSQLDEGKL